MSVLRACELRWNMDESQPWGCDCSQYLEPKRRTTHTGMVSVGYQCQRCGSWFRRKASEVPPAEKLEQFDDEIRRIWVSEQREKSQDVKDDGNRVWWEKYNAYLKTDKWRAKRALVLKRANGTCEACFSAPAVQAHHTTYDHVFDEPLFELRAVCVPCHERLTTSDRARRGSSILTLLQSGGL